MPRVREITMDGLTLRISPFSLDEAEKYLKESKELIEREPKLTLAEWSERTFKTVVFSLNKAAGNEQWTVEKLKAELDMPLLNHVYEQFLELSGLKLAASKAGEQPGEALATSTSR